MAVIKPVQFPHIERPAVAKKTGAVAAKNINPAQPQQPSPVQKETKQVRPGLKSVPAGGLKTTREEKLEVAIEVLRQKTTQFYGPKKKEVKQAAALGTIIDIKA